MEIQLEWLIWGYPYFRNLPVFILDIRNTQNTAKIALVRRRLRRWRLRDQRRIGRRRLLWPWPCLFGGFHSTSCNHCNPKRDMKKQWKAMNDEIRRDLLFYDSRMNIEDTYLILIIEWFLLVAVNVWIIQKWILSDLWTMWGIGIRSDMTSTKLKNIKMKNRQKLRIKADGSCR